MKTNQITLNITEREIITPRKSKKDISQLSCYKKAEELEKEILLKYAQMKVGEDIEIRNIDIIFQGQQTFLHTFICGQENEKVIVLIHGYLANSLFFYKMLKSLSQTYKVYSVDLLGMGLSDRKKFSKNNSESAQSVINFFVNSIEEWRQTMQIDNFSLVGHSFGGFIAFNYNIKYSQYVEQLILLSPMSSTTISPSQDIRSDSAFKNFISKFKFKDSLFLRFLRYFHNKKATVSTFLQSWYIPTNYLISKFMNQRLDFDSSEEKHIWTSFFKAMLLLPESTEHFVHELVSMPYVQPKLSIQEICEQFRGNKHLAFDTPIHFYYGSWDWMNHTGCQQLINEKYIQGTLSFIPNSGHLIPFEQPEQLVNMIKIQMNSQIQQSNILYQFVNH